MRSGRSLAGSALVVALLGAAAAAPRPDSFTLAIVRRDAVAIPFATFDGRRWKNTWPMPETRVTAPITLADIPRRWWTGREPAARWTFWPISGPAQTIDTVGPAWFPTHCKQQLGLRTTYRASAPVPPLQVQPYPKDGLAVSGTASITPIELLDAGSAPIAREIARELTDLAYGQEKEQVNAFVAEGAGWVHPYSEDERRATPLQPEALYKVARGLGDRDVYYIEAVKHYAVRKEPSRNARRKDAGREEPRREEPARSAEARTAPESGAAPAKDAADRDAQEPCDLVTFVSGWLARKGDEKLDVLRLTVVVTSCDFQGAFIMLPLGVVNVNGKPLWVAQWSGWTHEQFSVLEVKDRDVTTLITTQGGSCPRP